MVQDLDPELLLRAYASGIFPMAEGRDDAKFHWVDPSRRGVLPLDAFHISKSLRKSILAARFQAKFNSDFAAVVEHCAARDETWINDTIYDNYLHLHHVGHAHSQEIWDGDDLVGGVFGITLGSAFFGESMFSLRRDVSKIALAYLVDRLNLTGFTLFDTQFPTSHLNSLGGQEIGRTEYLRALDSALEIEADMLALSEPQPPADVIQRNTQTS